MERLGPRLGQIFGDALDRNETAIAAEPTSMAPERVLVFEIIGQARDFSKAAARVGLEWLAERTATLSGVDYVDGGALDEDDDADADADDLSEDTTLGDKGTVGRFYMAMPTKASFEELRRLWERYASSEKAPDRYGDWWDLFNRLHDLRPWGPIDRVPAATTTDLMRAYETARTARVEIDLWFHDDEELRASNLGLLKQQIEGLGGVLLDSADKPEIRYLAGLALLEGDGLAQLAGAAGPLAFSQHIMTVRPQAMFRVPRPEDDAIDGTGIAAAADRDDRPSLAALLDGYPVQDHVALRNRLDVIELEVAEALAPGSSRFHGTAMASLILHGDAQSGGPSIGRVLKVVPILAPDADDLEAPPQDKLVINLIFDAVEALKTGDHPAGKDVVIVNHSICDVANPFTGAMSPWGRALDHLAYSYKLLFVASVGNIKGGFPIGDYADIPTFRTAEPVGRRTAILNALEAAKAVRGILTPAESVNALAVGAAHADGCAVPVPANSVDPFGAVRLGNLASALGLGFGQMVRPDLLMDGGRQSAMPSGPPMTIHGFEASAHFGQLAACPDASGSLRKMRRSSGTSNAAALATRAGLLIGDTLDETFSGLSPAWHRRPTAPCMIKALIAHSCSWGQAGDELDAVLPPQGSNALRRRENIARYIGYGSTDLHRIVDGGSNRATLLADDVIRAGHRHTYELPLPDMLGRPEARRITITLAWLTPTRSETANYRSVTLDVVGDDGSSTLWSGVKRLRAQPPVATSRRGTLLHTVYEGRTAVAFAPGSNITLNVQASARFSSGLSKIDVPYALAVTVEIMSDVDVGVFQAIETRLRPRVRTR